MTARRTRAVDPVTSVSSATATLASLRESLTTRVEGLREQIAEAKERLAAVDEGDLPRAEFAERVMGWVDAQAHEFEREAAYGISGLRLQRPEPVTTFQAAVKGGLHPEGPVAAADLSGLMCWLFRDYVKEALGDLIQAQGYVEGPPSADRALLRKEIQAQLDALELAEERVIVEAGNIGLTIARRPDARPSIILSLQLSEAA